MAVQKPQGSQIDIQSVAADIAADATAIGSIATGVTSDPGATATLDADYLRVDGTNEAGVALFTNDANYQGQVVPGTAGDFAALDGSGNITDSGLGAADFATAAQGLLADSALQDITGEAVGDLSDVNDSSPADRHVLVYEGVTNNRYENRLLVKADVSDFSDGDYATAAQGLLADSALQDITAESVTDLSDTPAAFTGAGNQFVRVNNAADALEFVDELASPTDGTAGNPSIGFLSDNDTGLYSPGADSIAIAVGSNKALEIESDGTVNVNGTTDYETLVTDDDDVPNKKYVDDKTWDAGAITSGTFANARVAENNVTQHEAALTITESQISDLGTAAALKTDPVSTFTNDANYVASGDNVSVLVNDANYQGQVVPGTVGDFAALDASGNIIDGGAQASDFATAAQGTLADSATQPGDNVSTLVNDANYQGQVVPSTVGDFAALDASGNIIDGGAQASDFATAAQGTLADSATQPGDNVSTLTNDSGFTTDATVATNHYTKTEADAAAGSAGAKIDKVSGATAGNLAELDAAGEIVDSGIDATDVLTSADIGVSVAPANNPYYKSYSAGNLTTGSVYVGGWYRAPASSVTLTIGGTVTQNYGVAGDSAAAHAFVVASGAGGTDLVLTVSGTSIDDTGTRTLGDSEIIVPDTDAATTDQYFETAKKWLGVITFTLTGASGAFTFNYGLVKYEDFGNRNFTVTDFEATGLAQAAETGLNIELLHHEANAFVYNASAFVPNATPLISLVGDHVSDDDVASGENFAFKRAGLSQLIAGGASEGVIIRVSNSTNDSMAYMNFHIGVNF